MALDAGSCPRCGYLTGPAHFCPECGLSLNPVPNGSTPRSPGGASAVGGEGCADSASLTGFAGLLAWSAVRASAGGDGRSGRAAVGDPNPPASDGYRLSARAARQIKRYELARRLLGLARSHAALEHARAPIELAAVYLRRYDGRRATQEAYAWDLSDWLVWLEHAGLDPFEATLATIESYAREPLSKGTTPAPATVARRLACLSGFYQRVHFAGLIEQNPVAMAHRPRVPEPTATLGLSKERARELLRVARAAGPREALLVLMMLELGLRVSEAVGTDIEDLGEQGRHYVLAIRGKGQAVKASRVPLNAALIEAIERVKAGRARGPLLATATGNRMTRQHAGRLIKGLGAQIGLPRLHPHELRHAFVTLSLDEGEALRDVQDAARHADPRTTRRYDTNRNRLDRHPTHRLYEVLEPLG